jgi:hypothetical protein
MPEMSMPTKPTGIIKWVLAGLICIPLLLTFAWFMQGFVRQVIVIPGSYLLHIIKLLFEATPQILFWFALLIFVFVLILKSFSHRSVKREQNEEQSLRSPRRSRVGFWLIQLNQRNGRAQHRFGEFIERLTLDVLNFTYRMPHWQIERRLENGEIEVPAELKTFLHARRYSMTPFPVRLLQNSWQWLARRIKRPPQAGTVTDKSSDPELEIAIDFLEHQLEIQNDPDHF